MFKSRILTINEPVFNRTMKQKQQEMTVKMIPYLKSQMKRTEWRTL